MAGRGINHRPGPASPSHKNSITKGESVSDVPEGMRYCTL